MSVLWRAVETLVIVFLLLFSAIAIIACFLALYSTLAHPQLKNLGSSDLWFFSLLITGLLPADWLMIRRLLNRKNL